MRGKYFTCVFAVLLLYCTFQAKGAEEVPTPVKVSIVSDVSAVEAGKPFYLGVLFEVDPGWHIYWKNPGDSGLPTSVELRLPEGFKAGALKWPLPSEYRRAGGIVDYGYEDSLLLFAEVHVPEDEETGSVIDAAVKVSWVSCEEICIPASARLELKLPVSHNTEYVNSELFSKWMRALPVAATDERNPFKIEISNTPKDGTTETINISLESKVRLTSIELYPVPGNSTSVRNITYDKSGKEDRTDINFEVKSLSGNDVSDSVLDALVVFTAPSGDRSGVEFSIPLED